MTTRSLVQTSRFGAIDSAESEHFRLLRPLAGFPGTAHLLKVALPHQKPFIWLQSAEEPSVAFAAAPVLWLRPSYTNALSPWDQELWGPLGAGEGWALMSFAQGATANLAAPVLLDAQRRLALQIVNQPGLWSIAEPLAAA